MIALGLSTLAFSPTTTELEQLATLAPSLHKLVQRAESEPELLAEELRTSPLATIAPTFTLAGLSAGPNNASLPSARRKCVRVSVARESLTHARTQRANSLPCHYRSCRCAWHG